MSEAMQCDCQSCNCDDEPKKENGTKKSLVIFWQRLISNGDTCPRCGSTEDELDKAVLRLKEKLKPRGIEVILKKQELTLEEFKRNPLKSNKIMLNGQPLEDLLNAKTGHSKCCDVCGDEECRTMEAGEKSYETIPAELIVEAGIKAVSEQ
ncbi:MAG: DUF2703 domain-containing protein [Candidatus Moranbacteria bacterium]|nr:DUF2703 domain-containing protein [Candidatus Moranbacteria bacterium]